MGLRIDTNGLASEISRLVKRALSKVPTGRLISEVLTDETKKHVQTRYPGSSHWSPGKVKTGISTSDTGSTIIDIPGATRAYHDITIRPITASWLTIPIGDYANGRTAPEIDGLFKPKDKDILATVLDGQLVAVFALVKSAFQPQDSSLLPTDKHFSDAISERWTREFFGKL